VTAGPGPGGAIYDRGYRHYDGLREGPDRPVKAVLWAGVRRVFGIKRPWRTKIVPWGLFVMAFAPAVAFVGIKVLAGDAAAPLLGYGRFLRIVSVVLLLFAATAGPELLCPDRRQRVLTLLFTRPLTRPGYLAGKLGALLIVMGVIALGPLLVVYGGNALTSPNAFTFVREHAGDLGRVLFAGVAMTVFYAVVSLAFASLSDRRSVATAAFLGFFLATNAMAEILFYTATSLPGRRWLAFLAVQGIPGRFVDWLFGDGFGQGSLADQAGFGGPAYLAAMAVITVAAAALLARQIGRMAA
jgi:ABC-2 type transport system permease protein